MNIPTITHNGLSFINLNKPTPEQIKFLNKNFGFSMLNLEDYLYKTQVPKIETYKDYNLVVMDIPSVVIANKTKPNDKAQILLPNFFISKAQNQTYPKSPRKKRISIGEVDFFIGKDYLVVLHDEKTPQIDEIFDMCKITEKHREDLMGLGAVFLSYRIADVLVDSLFAHIEDITRSIDYIDDKLEEGTASVIEDISMTRRNIVVFETMIKPTLPIFSDLEKGKYTQLNGTMMPYWSNILDHLQKIWDRLEDNKELLEGLARSHESLLTIRTNEIIRVLTVFTAIMLPLTLLASMYGMNVKLPFQDYPHAFTVITSLMLILAIVMVILFRNRKWL